MFLPGFAGPRIAAFAATPSWTVIFVAVLASLLWRSGVLQDRIRSEMRALWERTLGLHAVTAPPPAWLPLRIHRFAHLAELPKLFSTFEMEVVAAGLRRAAAYLGERRRPDGDRDRRRARRHLGRRSHRSAPLGRRRQDTPECYPLGRSVEADRLYRVTVQVTAPWSDRRISTGPEGFGPTRMSFIGKSDGPAAPVALCPLVSAANQGCGIEPGANPLLPHHSAE